MTTPKSEPADKMMVFRATPKPKSIEKSSAYRKADKRVRDAIGGLFTADPPAELPALDSDRVTIVARLVRERDAVAAKRGHGYAAEGTPASPSKPVPRPNPRPLTRHKVIESIDALDEADRPRTDWEPEADPPASAPTPPPTSRRRSRSATGASSPSPTPMPVPRSRSKRASRPVR